MFARSKGEVIKYMINLSLKGNSTSLTSLTDESCIPKNIFNSMPKFIDKYIELLIIENETQRSIGYTYCYNYNSSDGFIYIKIININNENKFEKNLLEGCLLLFNYIFTMMPIRKIYYEIFEYELEDIKFIKKIGFKLEANLKEDKFFNGKYNNKYILSLYREDFYVRLNQNE